MAFPFYDLSFELPKIVLCHALDGFATAPVPEHPKSSMVIKARTRFPTEESRNDPLSLPNLAHTGHAQLRAECILLMLRYYTIWVIDGEPILLVTKWLSKIDFKAIDTGIGSGLDAVHSLLVTHNDRLGWLDPITHTLGALARRCPRLSSLCLEIRMDGSSLWPGISRQEINMGWIWSSNKLGHIEDIHGLQYLRLILKDAFEGEYDLAMHALAASLVSSFARRGKTIQVELDLRAPWQ